MAKTQHIKALIQRHKEQFIKAVSLHYPLMPIHLEEYPAVFDYKALSRNVNCNWDVASVKRHRNRLDFGEFQANSKFWADAGMIDYFLYKSDVTGGNGSESLPYESIETNRFVPWSNELIAKHEHWFSFYALCFNKHIPWNIELIDKYAERWSWAEFSLNSSLPFSDEFIARYQNCWNWGFLSMNKAMPWTFPLFEKCQHKIELNSISPDEYSCHVITSNFEIVESYPHLFDWTGVCSNHRLPWIEKNLLNHWEHRLDWFGLAGNKLLFENDRRFFEDNLNKWLNIEDVFDSQLSGNSALPWSVDLIDRFSGKWDWKRMATNTGLPWSTELIDRYLENLCFEPITVGGTEIEPGGLYVHHKVPWTLDWIIRYEKYIDFNALFQFNKQEIWNKIFKPVFNDEILREVLG